MASGHLPPNAPWNNAQQTPTRSWRSTPSRWREAIGRIKAVTVIAATLILLSLLTWVATWFLPPQPSRIVLLGTQYRDNLSVAHNAYGWNTLQNLASLGNEASDFRFWGKELLQIDSQPHAMREGDLGLDRLEESYGDTVVVYVSAHGIADGENAYLLLEDAVPSNIPKKRDDGRLSVDVLLDRLASLPKDRHKVLVLDATQESEAWEFGMIYNNFARVLHSRNQRITDIPNLVVISASDVNQRSWPCRAWHRTAFGHFFIEGLRGAATDKDHDGRLDLQELHHFTTSKVERWAHSYHRALQQPLLLPKGEEGLRRAAAVDLGVIRGNYKPASALPIAPEDEQSLASAFAQYESLAKLSPRPIAYAPLPWKKYETILLRMQSLVEAGDTAAVAHWQKELNQLAFQIRELKTTPLDSALCSLAMPTVAGENVANADSIASIVADLWQQAPTKVSQTYQKHLGLLPANTSSPVAVQAAVLKTLLERAAEDPKHNLPKAAAIALAIEDPTRARPAEIHFLMMLNDYLPRQEKNEDSSSFMSELVCQALQTRVLAEQVAVATEPTGQTAQSGYCQEVSLWCQTLVAAGDVKRRQAEDLLFVSHETAPRAAKLFTEAVAEYDQAAIVARQIRDAATTRDFALMKLPGYGAWLAAHLRQDGYTQSGRELLEKIEHLWQQTFELSNTIQLDADIAELPLPKLLLRADTAAKAAASLSDGLNNLDEQLQQWQRDLSQFESMANMDYAEAITVLPPADAQLRMELLRRKWRMMQQPDLENTSSGRYTPISKQDQSATAKMAAEVQGRLALASLGHGTFATDNWDSMEPKARKFEEETFAALAHRLQVFEVEEQWWLPLVVAGEQVAHQFNKLPPRIEELCEEARGKSRTGIAKLQRAALLGRQNLALIASDAGSPNQHFRDAALEELLIWQTSRSYRDHWDGLKGTSTEDKALPFFALTAMRYLDDAHRLDSADSRIADWKEALRDDFAIKFIAPKQLNWTTQQTQQIPLSMSAVNDKIGGGFAAVDVVAGQMLSLTNNVHVGGYALAVGSDLQRKIENSSADSSDSIQIDLAFNDLAKVELHPPSTCAPEATGLTVKAFFRGRQISQLVPIAVYPSADRMLVDYPQPQTARLAVVASQDVQQQLGSGRGAVSIVLDASGSMGPPAGQEMTATTRYRQALAAVESVIDDLPVGTQLSVWVFGEAVGSQKTVEQAERTIRQILKPTIWDGDRKGRLTQLMKSLDYPQVQPWNESPIVRTMLAAKGDLDSFQGPKTMIVITDGVDNRFAGDRTANPDGVGIATALAARFEASAISIQVIGFQIKSEEQQIARQQFDVVQSFLPPGGFTLVDHVDDLRATLSGALQQQLEVTVSPLNVSSSTQSSAKLSVGTFGGGDRWIDPALAQGSYKVTASTKSPAEAEVSLSGGDLLWLTLASEQGSLKFKNQPYAATRYPTRPFQTAAGWRGTLLENYYQSSSGGQWMLSLEATPDTQLLPLTVQRPAASWLELSPVQPQDQSQSSADTPTTPIQVIQCQDYPVPMLKVNQPGWPTNSHAEPSAPQLTLWWNVAGDIPGMNLRKHQEFNNLSDLCGREVSLGGNAIKIDSVALEKHIVATGEDSRTEQPCLVVRLSHQPGMPCLVKAGDLQVVGSETRIFCAAGQTTVLIWPVTAAAAAQVSSLQLIDLTGLKAQSAAAGRKLEFLNLPAPSAQSQPPTAVQ
jgi:hypothetical protein